MFKNFDEKRPNEYNTNTIKYLDVLFLQDLSLIKLLFMYICQYHFTINPYGKGNAAVLKVTFQAKSNFPICYAAVHIRPRQCVAHAKNCFNHLNIPDSCF